MRGTEVEAEGSVEEGSAEGLRGGEVKASWASEPSLESSSKVPTSMRGRLRWALGPKVSPKDSVSTM